MYKRRVCMKVRLLLALAPLILLSMSAMAQTDNCCHVDRLCITNDEWVAGYWAYQRNQCPAQAQPQASSASQPSDDIDNCCFVDRQCATDEEWVAGYWAFQNNECAAPAQQRQSTAAQTPGQSGASQEVDNCCFIGWQCSTDEEWVSGYWAYQANNQCVLPSQQQRDSRQPQSSSGSVKITYDPPTRGITWEYEGGFTVTIRRPTQEELCEALKREGLPLLPECEDN